MIQELKIDNLEKIDNSFLNKEYIKNELNNNPYAKILLLIENNEIIGYLYYSDIYERAEINQIEINNAYRNLGFGTKIMKFFTETVDKNITLEVNKENIPAIKLYKKFHFEEKAIRKGYYNGIDGLLMERKKDS